MATAIVVGTVIGSGVFKKPQVVAENVPFFGMAAMVWVLGGVLALLGALALGESAVLYPKAGGNYIFLREGYGQLAGFLWGWVEFCIIRSASIAALATVFAESLSDVLRNRAFQSALGLNLGNEALGFWPQRWLTIGVILGLAGVNVLGVRWSGGLQLFITIVKVGSLIAIAMLPFVVTTLLASRGATAPGVDETAAHSPRFSNLSPWWPEAWSLIRWGGLGTALLGVIWAYHGWMNITWVAEEVRNPQRNLPLALLAGVVIIIGLYLGANFAYYLVIPQSQMATYKDTPVVTEFSLRLLGPIGAAAASAAVMCSVFGALNGNLLAGSRMIYAVGQDGLAPRALGVVHPRFHTPALAITVLALWSTLLVLGAVALTRYRLPILHVGSWAVNPNVPEGKPLFDIMTDFAMFGAVIFETLAVAAIFVFRRRLPMADRPYRCPGYPVVPIVYVLIMAAVVTSVFINQQSEALAGVGFIGLGTVVYAAIWRAGVRKPPELSE
jgi:amino acid transporter